MPGLVNLGMGLGLHLLDGEHRVSQRPFQARRRLGHPVGEAAAGTQGGAESPEEIGAVEPRIVIRDDGVRGVIDVDEDGVVEAVERVEQVGGDDLCARVVE